MDRRARMAVACLAVPAVAGCGRSGAPKGAGSTPPGFLDVEYPAGLGRVTSDPPGIACGSNLSTCSYQFEPGATVTLTATNDPAVPFQVWEEDCAFAADDLQCELTLTSGRVAGASFLHRLRVAITGTASVASLDAQIACSNAGGTCEALYAPGAAGPRLDATLPVGRVVVWNGDCAPQAADPTLCDADAMTAPRDVLLRSLASSETIWAVMLGGAGDDRAYGVALDADGNPAVVGEFTGTIDFGEGPVTAANRSAFAASFDEETTALRWVSPIDGGDEDRAWGITATSGAGFALVGEFNSASLDYDGQASLSNDNGTFDGWVVSVTAADGALRSYATTARGGSDDRYFAVTGDPDGNLFCVGPTATDGGDGQVHRYDREEGDVDRLDVGDGGNDALAAAVATAAGDAILGGFMTSVSIELLGIPITLSSNGAEDAFLVKFDSALDTDVSIAKRYGGSGFDYALGVATDPGSGEIYVVGFIEGTDPISFDSQSVTGRGGFEVFVSKHDPVDGDAIWARTFGGTGNDYGYGIAVGNDGVAIIGSFTGAIDLDGVALAGNAGLDVFVAKLSKTDGTVTWAREFGSVGDDYGTAVAIDPQGVVVAVGFAGESLDFGLGPSTFGGAFDAFLVRLAP